MANPVTSGMSPGAICGTRSTWLPSPATRRAVAVPGSGSEAASVKGANGSMLVEAKLTRKGAVTSAVPVSVAKNASLNTQSPQKIWADPVPFPCKAVPETVISSDL